MTASHAAQRLRGAHMLRALRYRNYRLYFTGQSISLIGSWMTRIATSWLVYRLTGSALLLGLTGFAGQIPSFLLAPFAGVLVDRWDRQKLLVITQILALLQSLALAVLTLTHRITVAEIIGLSIVQGLINAFDMPGRQAFAVQMVDDKADLGNAIALNSSMINAGRLIGPALGGVIIAAVGEGYCFLIDSISYVAVIASLLMMRITVPEQTKKTEGMLVQLREGWSYVSQFTPVRNILILLAFVSLVGFPYTVLMPVFATHILHGGPATLGILMAATGVGALAGAITLANRRSVLGLGRVIPQMAALFGAGLIGFALSRNIWISALLLVATGFGFITQLASSNTLMQTIVDDDKRGRLMSYYTMSFQGTAPFGSLLAGLMAHKLGAPATLAIGGAGCIIGGLLFYRALPEFRATLRPIYTRMGILPVRTGEAEAEAATAGAGS